MNSEGWWAPEAAWVLWRIFWESNYDISVIVPIFISGRGLFKPQQLSDSSEGKKRNFIDIYTVTGEYEEKHDMVTQRQKQKRKQLQNVFSWKCGIVRHIPLLTRCGRVTQICVFNTVKLGTSASSPYCHSTRGNVSRGITPSSTTRVFDEYFLKISVHKNS